MAKHGQTGLKRGTGAGVHPGVQAPNGGEGRTQEDRREEVALLERGIHCGNYRVDGMQVARAMVRRASLRRK